MFSQFFYSVLKQSFSKKTSLSSSSRQTEALSLSTHFLKESSIALPKLYCHCSPSLSHTEALLLRFLYSLSLSLSLSLYLFSVLISEPKLFAGFLLWVRVSLIQPLRVISASIDLLAATDSKVSSLFR